MIRSNGFRKSKDSRYSLMARAAARVSDKRVLKLIRAFLNAGVMEDGLVRPVDEGTPQGGPLTPRTQKAISVSIE